MPGVRIKGSRADLVREFLRKHGPATIGEVVAAVGASIPASACSRYYDQGRKAMLKRNVVAYGRHKSIVKKKMEIGRRAAIQAVIDNLNKCGHIIKIRRGVYDLPPGEHKRKI